MHAQAARRAAGHALAVAPNAVGAVALAGALAHPRAAHGHTGGHVVGLGNALAAVRAHVAHAGGVAALPFQPVWFVFTTPQQGVVCAAVLAVDVVAHQPFGLFNRVLNVAQPFE